VISSVAEWAAYTGFGAGGGLGGLRAAHAPIAKTAAIDRTRDKDARIEKSYST
jgi:D-arabinose 1-dehydrogenase-like Zn-dependent alcohol dehydrogenase